MILKYRFLTNKIFVIFVRKYSRHLINFFETKKYFLVSFENKYLY